MSTPEESPTGDGPVTMGSASPEGAVAAPPGVRKSTHYFPELESLRGIAITLVMLYHADGVVRESEGKSGTVGSALAGFVHAGHSGVNLFFILSGFLLALPFLIEAGGGRKVGRRQYAERRALRILPLYYVAVVVAAVLTAATPGDLLRGLPFLLFLQGTARFDLTSKLMPYSGVWWTLATEAEFYLLLPFLPLCLRSRRGRLVGTGLAGAYAIAYVAYLAGVFHMQTLSGQIHLGLSLFGHAPLFLLGIAAAWLYLRHGEAIRAWLARTTAWRNGGADVLLFATLVLLGYELRWAAFAGFWGVEDRHLHAWHLVDGGLWTGVLLLLVLAPLWTKRLLSNRVWSELGVLSYSLYLLHYPIYRLGIDAARRVHPALSVGWSLPMLATVAVLTAACLAGSWLTYRLIERPFLVRKARIER